MAKKEYMFYPGCTAESLASASNYMTSVETMCDVLDIQLNEIPDWNCCGASIGYVGGGELPRLALNARNLAIAEEEGAGDLLPSQKVLASTIWCTSRSELVARRACAAVARVDQRSAD